MATNFTKNAEERPEPCKAEVKGKATLLVYLYSNNNNNNNKIKQTKICFLNALHLLNLKTSLKFLFVCLGNVPSWLEGTLLRNGPGIFTVGSTSYEHWFDGMAIMHSFAFKDGWSYDVVFLLFLFFFI